MDNCRYNSKRGLRGRNRLYFRYIRRRVCEVLFIAEKPREGFRGVDGNPRADDGKP